MSKSFLANKECIIYMDCEYVVNLVLKIKVGNELANGIFEDNLLSIIKQTNFSFRHVARNLNMGADDLAKQGGNRSHLIQGWF